MFEFKYEPGQNGFGSIHIIADGRDLSLYSEHGRENYSACPGSLLADWFKANLPHMLSDDPFPVEAAGETAAELCSDSYNHTPADKAMEEKFCQSRDSWLHRHAIECCVEGYILLPHVFFRRLGDRVEISWDNGIHSYDGIFFKEMSGVAYIDPEELRAEINAFIDKYSTT